MSLPSSPEFRRVSGRVRRKAEDKRRRILDAGLALFAELGFHGASVPLLAERAGVAAGTIYRFFPSKDALVNQVYRDAKQRMKSALSDEFDWEQAAKAQFNDVWARLTAFARAEPLAFRFLEHQDHTAYLDAESRALELSVLAPILEALLRFRDQGAVRCDIAPELVIASIWGTFIGLVKAERLGYLTLSDKALNDARDACWRAFAV